MNKALYFISDAHLGSGADSPQRERELVEFLDSIKDHADTLVLLGDIFDFWFTYRHVVPRGYSRIIGKLAELSDRGVKLHYCIGNHDMWVFDFFTSEMNAVMHNEPCFLDFDGRRFLIGHGDGMGNQDSNYLLLKRIFRSKVNQRLFSTIHPWIGFSIASRWSESSRKKHSRKYQHYMGDDKEGIVQYCRKRLETEPFDFCVFGHRHTPITRTITVGSRSAQYVNVGEWIDHRNYAVYRDGVLRLCDLKDATKEYCG